MSTHLLQTRDLTISFGAHKAVNNLSVSIEKGLFTTIIGPNGAGKTTFFNLLTGLLRPSSGQVLYKGTDITYLSPEQRVTMGMGRSFQLTNVFPFLTVHENVRLAAQSQAKVGYRMFIDYRNFKALSEKAERLLEQVLLLKKKDFLAASLTHGEQRKLELAMVLALEPDVLLLDEPTAGMALEEVPTMFDLLNNIKKDKDKTVVLIEHKMDLVAGLSDQVIVLVNGSLLVKDSPAAVSANPAVLAAYLGGGGSVDEASA